jgi:hypothetical protein
MKTALIALSAAALISAGSASALAADFDFTVHHQTQTISGELLGLSLDANGNANDADPAQVLLFGVPAGLGITASPANPYVFTPETYEESRRVIPAHSSPPFPVSSGLTSQITASSSPRST